MSKILSADIEADGLLDDVTQIWCICTKDYNTGEKRSYVWNDPVNSIEAGIAYLESADVVAFHNGIGYDELAIVKLYPDTKLPRCVDTLVMSRLIWTDIQDRDLPAVPQEFIMSHSLEAWGYRLKVKKGDFGKLNGFKEWNPTMVPYCETDVEILDKLLRLIANQRYSIEAMQLEHDFARIIMKQEISGFEFDMAKAQKLRLELTEKKAELEAQLLDLVPPTVTVSKRPSMYHYDMEGYYVSHESKGELVKVIRVLKEGLKIKEVQAGVIEGEPKVTFIPFNPGSTQQRVKYLQEYHNWIPTNFTEKGAPQCDEDALRSVGVPEADLLADYMKVSKIYSMLVGSGQGNGVPWLEMVGADGRMHGRMITNGAATGRCTHSSPNMGQVPSTKCYPKGHPNEGHPIYGFEGGYGADCRSLFTVPQGYKLIGVDLSGIEARILAHVLAPYDNGVYIDLILNGDVHSHNQEVAGLPSRNIAKKLLYMVMYGAGDSKVAKDIGVPLEEGAKMKQDLLDGIPALKKVVNALKGEKKYNKGWIRGLDGRKLWIRGDHAILNMDLQGAGALVMKKATVLASEYLEAEGYVYDEDVFYCCHVHDELGWAIKEGKEERAIELVIKAMQDAGKHFGLSIAIDGEGKIGNSWDETH